MATGVVTARSVGVGVRSLAVNAGADSPMRQAPIMRRKNDSRSLIGVVRMTFNGGFTKESVRGTVRDAPPAGKWRRRTEGVRIKIVRLAAVNGQENVPGKT